MEKSEHCNLEGYNSLNRFQREQFFIAIREFYEQHPNFLDIDSAGMAFLESENYRAWASGLKARFCNFLCPTRDKCGVVYNVPHYPQEDVDLPLIRAALEKRGFGFIYEASKKGFQAEVGRNKWFLSERKNYDVSWEDAQLDYIERYLDDFRRGFCSNIPAEVIRRELRDSDLRELLFSTI